MAKRARGLLHGVGTLCMVAALTCSAAKPDHTKVPGVVINYSAAASGLYVGSPSIAVLPGGDYVASHDLFGPKSKEHRQAMTRVFRSGDRGETWQPAGDIRGQFWSNLFVHRGALYILGTYSHYGNVVIRRSEDGGRTWSEPADEETGLLFKGHYHCAPMPVLEHKGRLWRAMEDNGGRGGWGKHFRSYMLSVPVDADLLDASLWRSSNPVTRDADWLEGRFGGWLEGNAVVAPAGKLVNILRVDTPSCPEKAAIISISPDGKDATFDPAAGFIDFPGGAKKFTIRHDPESDHYWSLATFVPKRHQRGSKPGGIRNTLALTRSPDLRTWEIRCVLVYRPETRKHGFQYPDWQFDGKDIIAAVRTAHDDGVGGAHNFHDANYLTFHRIRDFRKLAMDDSCAEWRKPLVRVETPGVVVEGRLFSAQTLDSDQKAYANRDYVWKDVPAAYRGWRFTQTSGGVAPSITVRAKKDTVVHMATGVKQKNIDMTGWDAVPGASFWYTDKGRSRLGVFGKTLAKGETLRVPQGNWTGGIVLIPGERTINPTAPKE